MLALTILVFVCLLLLLVLVHEWGHFFAAKRAGCGVQEFAFGFPPRLFSIRRGETRYSFNLLPLGGYVKIEGEDMDQPGDSPTSFSNKSPAVRIFILSAGVLMNIVLAAVLLSFQAGLGVPVVATEENAALLSDIKTFVVAVDAGSPAAAAGLEPFDYVTEVGSVRQPTVTAMQEEIAASAGREIILKFERQGTLQRVAVIPRVAPPLGEGALGVALQETGLERTPIWQAPWRGVVRTGEMLVAIVNQFRILFWNLVTGNASLEAVTGPVGIAVFTHEVTSLGLSYILEFGALISLNLALINILPFPALDGGRILFVGLEMLAGRRLPVTIERRAHLAGFALLIALMLFVTLKDVARFF
jgi:regulator of sigma E protease